MALIRRILFPVDFSVHCENAAPYVAALASRLNAQLDLLYVVDTGPIWYASLDSSQTDSPAPHWTKQWKTMLCNFGRSKFAGLPFRCSVREGEVAAGIVQFAKDEGVDLITMPTLGCTSRHPFAVGSVTDSVLHHAPCPVWVTSEAKQFGLTGPLVPRVVMCAVELIDEEVSMMQFGALFAAALGARLLALHVTPESRSLVTQTGGAADAAVWESFRRRSGLDIDLLVSEGDVGRQIQEATVDRQVDLLIMGRRRLRDCDSALKTHVYSIIARSNCPVLVC